MFRGIMAPKSTHGEDVAIFIDARVGRVTFWRIDEREANRDVDGLARHSRVPTLFS